MKTIMFLERPENKGKMIVDFHLNKHNYYNAPNGVIRIARFEFNFNPLNNIGYYGDIYMKKFIQKWKKINLENIQRKKYISITTHTIGRKYFYDIVNSITQFL